MLTLRTSMTSPSRSRGSEAAGVLASNAPSQALVCFDGKSLFEVGTHAEAEHGSLLLTRLDGMLTRIRMKTIGPLPNWRNDASPRSRRLVLDEPLAPLRFGHHAVLVAAEQAIAVAGNAIVEPAADRSWYHPQHAREPPGTAKLAGDGGDGVELDVRAALDQHEIGFERLRVEAVVAKERLADQRLGGGETECEVRIPLQNEAGKARAQHAHAVEHHECLVVGKRGHVGVGTIAIGRGLREPLG